MNNIIQKLFCEMCIVIYRAESFKKKKKCKRTFALFSAMFRNILCIKNMKRFQKNKKFSLFWMDSTFGMIKGKKKQNERMLKHFNRILLVFFFSLIFHRNILCKHLFLRFIYENYLCYTNFYFLTMIATVITK